MYVYVYVCTRRVAHGAIRRIAHHKSSHKARCSNMWTGTPAMWGGRWAHLSSVSMVKWDDSRTETGSVSARPATPATTYVKPLPSSNVAVVLLRRLLPSPLRQRAVLCGRPSRADTARVDTARADPDFNRRLLIASEEDCAHCAGCQRDAMWPPGMLLAAADVTRARATGAASLDRDGDSSLPTMLSCCMAVCLPPVSAAIGATATEASATSGSPLPQSWRGGEGSIPLEFLPLTSVPWPPIAWWRSLAVEDGGGVAR